MSSLSARRSRGAGAPSPSALTIRTIVVDGHRTSVRLEPLMWESLRDIARRRGVRINELVTEIDRNRDIPGLTAAIRVYIVGFYRNALGSSERAETAPLPM